MKGEYEEERVMTAVRLQQRECHTSEEEESGGTSGPKRKRSGACTTDGASIEVVRRPRGRPPGSKNKPKPPLIITREAAEPTMRPHILQVPTGIDLVEAVSRFARSRNVGLCILTASGSVSNVTLRNPSASSSTVTFPGRFEILSISATLLPPNSPSSPCVSSGFFTISIAGAQGQVVGGSVVGSLVAAGTVLLVATVFSNPSFHRLPAEDEISASGPSLSGIDLSPPQQHEENHHHHHHHHHHQHQQSHESHHVMDYSCHLPSDVIWAPIARPPPPPY